MKSTIYLPQFTIGEEAFDGFSDEMPQFGKSAAVLYGETAWQAAGSCVLAGLHQAGIAVTCSLCYGKEATIEQAEWIGAHPQVHEADFLVAVGGGKCMDTVKLAADRLEKPVFTVPTIASNCAPVTQISILYHPDGSFREIIRLKSVPNHCFINPRMILSAPERYLWAGIGDALAKHVESEWSAKRGERLSYGSELGITAGRLCYYPLLHEAGKALVDVRNGIISDELEKTILNVVISPGITSVSVHSDYNGGIAHALFYGLTIRKHIERNHLHGEVVSYGVLVSLMLDDNQDQLQEAYAFCRSIGLPTCLADLELSAEDPLEDVLEVAMANQELLYTPYPVTAAMIHQAILALEDHGISKKLPQSFDFKGLP